MRRIGEFIALLGLLLLVYAKALKGAFVMDDVQYIADNPMITMSWSPRGFWTEFQQTDYWPLFYTALWWMWKSWGNDLFGYHVVNLVIHTLNTMLWGQIWTSYGLSKRTRYWALLVFALHPLAVASVAWIFQLKTILSTTFALLSFLFFIRSQEKTDLRFYFLSLIAFVAGLLTKASVVFLPLLFCLHLVWLGRHDLKTLLRTLPFFAFSTAGGLTTLYFNHRNFNGGIGWAASFLEKILVSFQNFVFYLGKIFWPHPLSFAYEWRSAPPELIESWLPLLAFVGVTWFLWQQWKKTQARSWLAAFLLWLGTFSCLAPALGFIEVPYMRYSLLADQYAYLALGCGVGAVSLWLQRFFTGNEPYSFWLIPFCFAILSGHQAAFFRGPETLWKEAAFQSPNSTWAHFNLAGTYGQLKRYPEAETEYEVAAYAPSDSPPAVIEATRQSAIYGLAHTQLELGKVSAAAATLESLLQRNPRFVNADYNLAMIYHQRLGDLDRAEKLYLHAINERDPNNSHENGKVLPALTNLCNIALLKKDYAQAKERCMEAAKRAPLSTDVQLNLGRFYLETKNYAAALPVFQELEGKLPNNDIIQGTLGEIHAKLGHSAEARSHFEKALQINPFNPQAREWKNR
jgi:protein O-mannosyl-transferase